MREGGDRLAGHDLRAVLTNWPDTIAKAEHPDACARGAGAESGSGYVPSGDGVCMGRVKLATGTGAGTRSIYSL